MQHFSQYCGAEKHEIMESRPDGEGKHARRRKKKCGVFHSLPDSEIYTTEYMHNMSDE